MYPLNETRQPKSKWWLFLLIPVVLLLVILVYKGVQRSSDLHSTILDEYAVVKDAATAKCGDTTQLVMVVADFVNKPLLNAYFFTSGTCGTTGQILTVIYNIETKTTDSPAKLNDRGNVLLRPIPPVDWVVSYQESLNSALLNGGQKFIDSNPGVLPLRAVLTNKENEGSIWNVIIGKPNSYPRMVVIVDPKNAKVISSKQIDSGQ